MLNRQGAHRARSGMKRLHAGTSRSSGSFVKAGVGAGALLATLLVLAGPAHAHPAHQFSAGSTAQHGAGVAVADDHAVLGDATSRAGLPFARPDLAILVMGGAIVTMAAAGAPLLLRPLRAIPPVFVASTAATEPLLPVTAQGAAARAHA